MPPPAYAVDFDAVLNNSSWVRELALRLVNDADQADELVQEAYVIALAKHDSVRTSFPGWIRTVLQNLVRERARTDWRRKERERASAGGESGPSTLDVVEKIALHRQVADTMLGLKEPYREALYLRYFEDLPPSAIAKSQGIPVSTVKTRLDRGLKQMRRLLDDAHGGDRRAWALPMLAMPLPEAVSLGAVLSGFFTTQGTRFAVGAAAILTAAFSAVWFLGEEDGDLVGAPATAATGDVVASGESLVIAEKGGTGTERFLAPIAPLPSYAQKPPGALQSIGASAVRGNVIGVGGARRIAVTVQFQPSSGFPSDSVCSGDDQPRDLSDFEGLFAVEGITDRGVLLSASRELQTLFAGRILHDIGRSAPTVVVGPSRTYSGKVIDDAGVGVAGATVALELPRNFRSIHGVLSESSIELRVTTTTGENGEFVLTKAAFAEGASVRAARLGFLDGAVALTADRENGLVITLPTTTAASDAIPGLVLDSAGAPAPGALISDGIHVTRSDASGRFWISQESAGPRPNDRPKKLVAVLAGHQPGYFIPRSTGKRHRESRAEVSIRLGPAPLTIRGEVVDGSGLPAAGILVWVTDPSLFAHPYASPGQTVQTRIEGAGSDRDPWVVENLTAGLDRRMWAPVRTDESGRFVLRGLSAREYRVAAVNKETIDIVTKDRVPAGTDTLRIHMSKRLDRRTVRGRVEFVGAAPASRVSIGLQLKLLELRSIHGRVFRSRMHWRRAQTDEDGGFELTGVPVHAVTLFFEDGGILPVRWDLPACPRDQMVTTVRVDATRRTHVQVVLADPDAADAVGFVDESGQPARCHVVMGGRHIDSSRARITGGRSEILAVSESVAQVEVFKSGKLIRTVPVSLVPGRLQSIRVD